MARHFLSQTDLSRAEIEQVFDLARRMKAGQAGANDLQGRSLVMFFEKASTRTRLSFEIGMTQLGGHAIYLDRESSQLSRGESISDTARVISRYADMVMARVNDHATVTDLAASSAVPVINGLSDEEHPCQSMADLFTLVEHRGTCAGCRIAYIGDGNNNVTHSLMLGAASLGADIVIASPPQLQPDPSVVERASHLAREQNSTVEVTVDPNRAADGADVLYTDVWVSMGRETGREERVGLLTPYQVNESLASRAKSDFLFMHCLPAHIGEEVTEEVAYGPHSVIFDEAENRLHVQKALMTFLFAHGQGVRG